jgi:two-component system, cell cycle sensor histidine kinase and response regulator CckA
MGLASAFGIIQNHKGVITVYSEVGQGSTFNIYLPLSDKTPEIEKVIDKDLVRGSATILFVDDEENIIEVGKEMLEILGYDVITALGGKEALESVYKYGDRLDLVILDMIMPEIDGGKVFERIHAMNPNLPVILSSGYSINGKAAEILDGGCRGFIQKPFSMEELSRKIREGLNP